MEGQRSRSTTGSRCTAPTPRRSPPPAGRVIPSPRIPRPSTDASSSTRSCQDFSPHDPAGVLRHEWANSRGCIARFTRNAIEIRVLDVQECPAADLSIAHLVTAVLGAICSGHLGRGMVRELSTDTLAEQLLATIREGESGGSRAASTSKRSTSASGATPSSRPAMCGTDSSPKHARLKTVADGQAIPRGVASARDARPSDAGGHGWERHPTGARGNVRPPRLVPRGEDSSSCHKPRREE